MGWEREDKHRRKIFERQESLGSRTQMGVSSTRADGSSFVEGVEVSGAVSGVGLITGR